VDDIDVKNIVKQELTTYKDQIMALRTIVHAYESIFLKLLKVGRTDLLDQMEISTQALGITVDQQEIIFTLLKQD
jgi:hypothetical protein